MRIRNFQEKAIYLKFKNEFQSQFRLLSAASLPEGLILKLRLSVAKHLCFNPPPLGGGSLVGQMIRSKIPLIKFISLLEYGNIIKNSYFDSEKTGLIILNEAFELVECNYLAKTYLSDLLFSKSIPEFFRNAIIKQSPSGKGLKEMPIKISNFDDYEMNVYINHYLEGNKFAKRNYLITLRTNEANRDEVSYISLLKEFNLTQRECEIVELLMQNLTYTEISKSLYVSINTVRAHIKNIYRKLNIKNQGALFCLINRLRSL